MVIKNLEVVFNPEHTKQEVLPKGYSFDCDSPVVVLAGENGSGKSMFLRMLQTSLHYERHFRDMARSKVYGELDIDKLNIYSAGASELYKNLPHLENVEAILGFNTDFLLEFYSKRNPEIGIDLEKDILLRQYEEEHFRTGEIETKKNRTMRFDRYEEIIKGIEEMCLEPTDMNVWGYLKPEATTPYIYTTVYAPGRGIAQSNAKISSQKQQAHFDFEIRPTEKHWSSGQDLMRSTDRFWRSIENFYDNHKVQDTANDSMENMGWLMRGKDPEIDIPEKEVEQSKLVVLMDEPTVFLSYGNKYSFRDQVQECVQKYGDEIQFFVATNDAIMIENFPEAKYLDFNSHPIAFKDEMTPWKTAKIAKKKMPEILWK